jgi:hypothetical protein
MRFEVLLAMNFKIMFFRDVTPCDFVEGIKFSEEASVVSCRMTARVIATVLHLVSDQSTAPLPGIKVLSSASSVSFTCLVPLFLNSLCFLDKSFSFPQPFYLLFYSFHRAFTSY